MNARTLVAQAICTIGTVEQARGLSLREMVSRMKHRVR